jgi:hypothetical protein
MTSQPFFWGGVTFLVYFPIALEQSHRGSQRDVGCQKKHSITRVSRCCSATRVQTAANLSTIRSPSGMKRPSIYVYVKLLLLNRPYFNFFKIKLRMTYIIYINARINWHIQSQATYIFNSFCRHVAASLSPQRQHETARSKSYDFWIDRYIQRPRCSRLERFQSRIKIFLFSKRARLQWRCKSKS